MSPGSSRNLLEIIPADLLDTLLSVIRNDDQRIGLSLLMADNVGCQ